VFTAGFQVSEYRALPAAGSDHMAVAVTLEPLAAPNPAG
jgi:endonuclease/exonuclease/phosphatase (EEP) superfamily protein YafD